MKITSARGRRICTSFISGAVGAGLLAVVAVQVTPINRLKASDHLDSPTVAQDRGADIADMYAFLDPNDNNMMVLVLSTQGFIVSSEHFGMAIFDHNIRYRFEIENTGDAQPDAFVDVTYSRGLGRQTAQTATIVLPNGRSFTAPTTIATQEYTPPPPVITTDPASGVSFFGGVADDPFFLDDTGANRFVASSIANPGHPNKALLGERGRDTYAGFNTMITALRIPVALLRGTSNNIGVNAETQRRRYQVVLNDGAVQGFGDAVTIDRDGNPLVNNGLIPAPRKNEYNGATTVDDANGRFQADIIKSLQNLTTDDAHINMILDKVQRKGDILRVMLNVPNSGPQGGNNTGGGFPMSGRRLTDDVVDATFTLINNGVHLGDNVDANQVPFRDTFPFVHDPIQPFPPGSGPDDQTRQ
ncbi:MAG: DUF4331 domain-containing protein [Armatimonadota bacterium]|nr:DUF4331 domain-containing protein [Armatimonadota bacterium]